MIDRNQKSLWGVFGRWRACSNVDVLNTVRQCADKLVICCFGTKECSGGRFSRKGS